MRTRTSSCSALSRNTARFSSTSRTRWASDPHPGGPTLRPTHRDSALRYGSTVRWISVLVLSMTALVAAGSPSVHAAPASGFTDSFVASVDSPTAVEMLPGGRVVVLEQNSGRIRIIDSSTGQLLPTPAAQLAVCGGGERGLLGFTHDPTFVTSGRVYVFYTRSAPGEPGGCVNRVDRVRDVREPDQRCERAGADRQHLLGQRQSQRRRPRHR